MKVETDLPDAQLALIGCGVTTGVGAALNTAKVEPGSTVAVIGCGGVGQAVIQGARIAGRGRIIAIDPVELKRKTAEQLGATDLVDPARRRPGRAGAGAHRRPRRRLRVRGDRPAGDDRPGLHTARRGGTVDGRRHAARGRRRSRCRRFELFYDEKTLLGCMYGSAQVRRDFPRFVELVETGRLDLGSMVSRRSGSTT